MPPKHVRLKAANVQTNLQTIALFRVQMHENNIRQNTISLTHNVFVALSFRRFRYVYGEKTSISYSYSTGYYSYMSHNNAFLDPVYAFVLLRERLRSNRIHVKRRIILNMLA